MDEFSSEEREQVQLLVRSAGWRVVMQHIVTPLLMQTNMRLDAPTTPEPQTQLLRGSKQTLKHLIETVYNLGQMPNPFEDHMKAFLVTLNVQAGNAMTQENVDHANKATEKLPILPPRKRSFSPVL